MVCDTVVLTKWCVTRLCVTRDRSQPSPIRATPATQNAIRCRQVLLLPRKATAASRASCATKRTQARHQTQPSPISATPATQDEGRCRQAPSLPRKTQVDVSPPSATFATQDAGRRWCVKEGVTKMVCDKEVWKMVCERECDKDGVWKMVFDKEVWQRGVWKMVCERRCERWCVTKLCVKDGVWQRCVWKMVCDKDVCDQDGDARRERRRERRREAQIKNKSSTHFFGEIGRSLELLRLSQPHNKGCREYQGIFHGWSQWVEGGVFSWNWDEDHWEVKRYQPDDLWIFLMPLSHLPACQCCLNSVPSLSGPIWAHTWPRSLSLLNDFLALSIHAWLYTRQMPLKWWLVVNLQGNWTASCQLS